MAKTDNNPLEKALEGVADLFYECHKLRAHVDGCLAMVRDNAEENSDSLDFALVDISGRLVALAEKIETRAAEGRRALGKGEAAHAH